MNRAAGTVRFQRRHSQKNRFAQEKAQGQGKPKSPEEQRAIGILRGDPQMQAAFFSQIATPVVTKMFQCGMIP